VAQLIFPEFDLSHISNALPVIKHIALLCSAAFDLFICEWSWLLSLWIGHQPIQLSGFLVCFVEINIW